MNIARTFLPAACCLALALAGPAQAQTAPVDTARFYKHHLGLTASPQLDQFFTANRRLPVGLLYKRQTAPNKLWRFGVVLNQDYSRRDENNRPLPAIKSNEEYVHNNLGISANVGREFTRRFSQRWTGTAGVDVSIGFASFMRNSKLQRTGDAALSIPPTEYEQTDYFRYYQSAFAPFAGLRFAIQPNLYVSAESSINLAYSLGTIKSHSTVTDLASGDVTNLSELDAQKITDQTLSLRFRLINQVTLHYRFGHQ